MGRQMGRLNPALPSRQSQTTATWTGKAARPPGPTHPQLSQGPETAMAPEATGATDPLTPSPSQQPGGHPLYRKLPRPLTLHTPGHKPSGVPNSHRDTLHEEGAGITDTTSDHELETQP